jgi:hypothetical protein
VQRTFLGEKTDYQVALGATVLQVTTSGQPVAGLLEPGAAVSVQFKPEGMHALD